MVVPCGFKWERFAHQFVIFTPFQVLLKIKRAFLSSFLSLSLWEQVDALLNIVMIFYEITTPAERNNTRYRTYKRGMVAWATAIVKHG